MSGFDVLGVDQSLTMTGLARHQTLEGLFAEGVTRELLDLDRVKTTPAAGLEPTRNRIRYIVAQTLKFAPQKCLSVIEAPYVPKGGKAAGSVLERAWLFGLLVDQLMQRGPVVQVRTMTRAMYATDSGNASKEQVLEAMRARFPNLVIRDDNEADALALLCMGTRFLGRPIDGTESKKQKQAMTSVVWPDISRSNA